MDPPLLLKPERKVGALPFELGYVEDARDGHRSVVGRLRRGRHSGRGHSGIRWTTGGYPLPAQVNAEVKPWDRPSSALHANSSVAVGSLGATAPGVGAAALASPLRLSLLSDPTKGPVDTVLSFHFSCLNRVLLHKAIMRPEIRDEKLLHQLRSSCATVLGGALVSPFQLWSSS